MQPPVALCNGKLVVRTGEMVHADVDEPRVREATDRHGQHCELLVGRWKFLVEDAPLRLEHVRQVGVAVERDAVGADIQHAVDRPLEALGVLFRKSVDQVHVDGLESGRPRLVHDGAGGFLALDPVDRLLHDRIEILDADAHPVHAKLAEQADRARHDAPRIDLDRVLARCVELEMAGDDAHQLTELLRVQEGRRSTTPVQLGQTAVTVERIRYKRRLASEIGQVSIGPAVVARHDLVARAIETDGVAERQVDIERERPADSADTPLRKPRLVDVLVERFHESVRGRIRRVPRAVVGELPEDVRIDHEGLLRYH